MGNGQGHEKLVPCGHQAWQWDIHMFDFNMIYVHMNIFYGKVNIALLDVCGSTIIRFHSISFHFIWYSWTIMIDHCLFCSIGGGPGPLRVSRCACGACVCCAARTRRTPRRTPRSGGRGAATRRGPAGWGWGMDVEVSINGTPIAGWLIMEHPHVICLNWIKRETWWFVWDFQHRRWAHHETCETCACRRTGAQAFGAPITEPNMSMARMKWVRYWGVAMWFTGR